MEGEKEKIINPLHTIPINKNNANDTKMEFEYTIYLGFLDIYFPLNNTIISVTSKR